MGGVTMPHLIRLVVTVGVGIVSWKLWAGFSTDIVAFDGLQRQLQGTWLWDLRYPLMPAYAVLVLWTAEKTAALLTAARR